MEDQGRREAILVGWTSQRTWAYSETLKVRPCDSMRVKNHAPGAG
jgi:hypothetical protein